MKIFLPKISWIGNFEQYITNAFINNSIKVESNSNKFIRSKLLGISGLRAINAIQKSEMTYYLEQYGRKLVDQCVISKPDVFFIFNESRLLPHYIKEIKERCKCLMVCAIGDNPWDSIRWGANFPHSLKYYNIILSADPSWNNNIQKVAPKSKIYWHYGGVENELFHPIDRFALSEDDLKRFTCDISFTGSSYAKKVEGAYRSDILSYITDFDLKIWGSDNWQYRIELLPSLKGKYQGDRLSYDELIKLYTLSKINLNLPAPQVILGFQPRIFEIAAVKGFQIVDNRPMIRELFTEEEVVTFNTIGELREKISYYLSHEFERDEITNRLYKKVSENFTWNHWAKSILDIINGVETPLMRKKYTANYSVEQ